AFQILNRSAADAQTLLREVAIKEHQNGVQSAVEKLRWKPDDWEAHYNLALLYDQADDIPRALEHYEQAVRIRPDGTWARNNLGTLYLNLGRRDEAVAQFNQVLKVEPA